MIDAASGAAGVTAGSTPGAAAGSSSVSLSAGIGVSCAVGAWATATGEVSTGTAVTASLVAPKVPADNTTVGGGVGWLAVNGCRPGMRSVFCKIITQSTKTAAPAIASDGVSRRFSRSHSSQPVRCRAATERGVFGGAIGVGTCTAGVTFASSVATLATGLDPSVAATSVNTCFFNCSANSGGSCFIGKCLRNNACNSCSFRCSAIIKPRHLQMHFEIGDGHD